ESIDRLARPAKLAFEPPAPVAVIEVITAIDQPSPDLDHVGDDALAEAADLVGVLVENAIDGWCRMAAQRDDFGGARLLVADVVSLACDGRRRGIDVHRNSPPWRRW